MTILCKPDECTLLVIDTQVRLMPAIQDGEGVIRRCVQLATAARELGVHVIGTEENPERARPARRRGRVALRHDARQAPLLGAGRGRLPAPPSCRARHARRRRLRGARLRAADGRRADRGRSLREVGRRRGRLAPPARPSRRDRARALARRRHRDDGDGHLRVARHQRASEVQAALAADPLSGRPVLAFLAALARRLDPDDDPAAHTAIEQRAGLGDRIVEPDLLGDEVERAGVEIARQPLPRLRRRGSGAITLSMPAA